jgi:hypothetical protein
MRTPEDILGSYDWRGLLENRDLFWHVIRAIQSDASRSAARSERERAAALCTIWTKPAEIRLRAGEMTAQEMRTAIAVATAIRTNIAALPDVGDGEGEA